MIESAETLTGTESVVIQPQVAAVSTSTEVSNTGTYNVSNVICLSAADLSMHDG